MDLELTDTLDSADRASLFEWDEQVFPVEGRAYRWSQPTHHILARIEGTAIAHLGFGRYEILDSARARSVIGVGGVVVRPEWQGRRIPQSLFDFLHGTPVLDARETPCTLFCPPRLEPYYSRYEYRPYGGEVRIPCSGGIRVIDFRFMYRGGAGFSESITLTTDPW